MSNVPEQFSSRPTFDPVTVDVDDARFADLFNEMARRGVVLDATMYIYRNASTHARGCLPELMIALARKALAAGVSISTGTDFFNPSDEPYPSVHMEISYLVEIGVLTPSQAIVAATRNGARAIGIEATHGTIEEGKVADLVILAENPLEDIAALRTVIGVFRRGTPYMREDYTDR
jgi:imidazolonepropionase-like amidohydrolase